MKEVLFKERKAIHKPGKKQEMSSLINVLIGFGFIVMSIFLMYNGARSLQIAQEKKGILRRAQSEVTDLRLKNISLLLEENKIETDDFTEIDIRNRLNYSKKGEKVFVISQEALELAKMQVERILTSNKPEKTTKNTWEIWKELFIVGV